MPDEKKPWREIAQREAEVTKVDSPSQTNKGEAKSKLRREIISGYIQDSLKCMENINNNEVEKIENIADILIKAHDEGKQIFTLGNGGAASVASHLAADLSKAWLGDRLMRLKAICLTDNVSLVTAWMNDAGYDYMFVGPLENLLNSGDIVIGISASGNSKNVLNAIEYANKRGAITVGFTGFDGGKLKGLAQHCFIVPSDSFKRVEDFHMILGHMIKAVLVNEIKSRITS